MENQTLNYSSSSSSSSTPLPIPVIKFHHFTYDVIPIAILWIHTILINSTIAISIISRSEKTYLNLIYLSITLSDLLTAIVCITFEIFYQRVDSYFIEVILCIIDRYIEYSSVCISLYSLLLLSIHRYYRMTKPADEKESMTRRRYVCLGLIWSASIFFWIFLYLVLNDFIIDVNVCDSSLDFYLVLVLDFFLQVCPLFALILFNVILLRHIWKNVKKYKGIKLKYLIKMKNSRYPKKLKKGKLKLFICFRYHIKLVKNLFTKIFISKIKK